MTIKSCARVCAPTCTPSPIFKSLPKPISGAAAVTAVEQHQPDVVLMDLEMPGELDGIAATRQIRKLRPETQVIVVTSHHQDEYIFPAVRAGAISYLLKDVEPDELAAAIRKAAPGRSRARFARGLAHRPGTAGHLRKDESIRSPSSPSANSTCCA